MGSFFLTENEQGWETFDLYVQEPQQEAYVKKAPLESHIYDKREIFNTIFNINNDVHLNRSRR